MKPFAFAAVPAAAMLLAACGSGAGDAAGSNDGAGQGAVPVAAAQPASSESDAGKPYDGIAPDEVLHFTGTEPFWGGQVSGDTLTYTTPEDQDGTKIAVERFAGRGGLAYSGRLGDGDFEMMVTPLSCSDGMSDRTYPFTVTVQLGGETRNGCGWTEAHPYGGPEQP